jgi:hypothetical protein
MTLDVPSAPGSTVAPPVPVPLGPAALAGPTNGFAIASLVLSLAWLGGIGSLLGVVFGHVALRRINRARPPQAGRGLAVAGLVLGYVFLVPALVVAGALIAGSMVQGSFESTSSAVSPSDAPSGAASADSSCFQTLAPKPDDPYQGLAEAANDLYNDGCRAGAGLGVDGAADETTAMNRCQDVMPADYTNTVAARAWLNGCLHAAGVPEADARNLLGQL